MTERLELSAADTLPVGERSFNFAFTLTEVFITGNNLKHTNSWLGSSYIALVEWICQYTLLYQSVSVVSDCFIASKYLVLILLISNTNFDSCAKRSFPSSDISGKHFLTVHKHVPPGVIASAQCSGGLKETTTANYCEFSVSLAKVVYTSQGDGTCHNEAIECVSLLRTDPLKLQILWKWSWASTIRRKRRYHRCKYSWCRC